MFRFKYYRSQIDSLGLEKLIQRNDCEKISQPFNTVENYRLCFRFI